MGIRQMWRDYKMLREMRTVAREEASMALMRGDDVVEVRHRMDRFLARRVDDFIRRALDAEIPQNEHYRQIRDEVVEQLNRWPALKSDHEMREKVTKAIADHFMRVR